MAVPRERSGAEEALAELVGSNMFSVVFDQVTWAHDEIDKAKERHPDRRSDDLERARDLLNPRFELMKVEKNYRAHCRELLDRVVAGEDTRPPTAAEICCVCAHVSGDINMPISHGAQLVYMRAFERAFPGALDNDSMLAGLENIAKLEADELERATIRKLSDPERKLPPAAPLMLGDEEVA